MAIDWDAYRKKAKKLDGNQNNISNNDIAPIRTTTSSTIDWDAYKKKAKALDSYESPKKDDDIGPVKTTKKKDDRTWFQKSEYFADGKWDKGDLIKTILGSATDIAEDLGTGIVGMGETALDTLATIAPYLAQAQFSQSGGYYNTEATKGFNAMQEEAKKGFSQFVEKDLYDEEKIAKKIISAPIKDVTGVDVETSSVFGEKTDSLAQSGGQLLATAGLQAVGVPWFLTTGATSFGSQAETALKEGATYEEATASGLISAGAEILTEKLSGGISFGGKTLDDVVLNQITQKISNKVVKSLVKIGLDATGEGAEEVVSCVLSNLGTALYKEEDVTELLFSEEAIDGYIESFIGGAALGGFSSTINEARSKNVLTENEQKVVDKVVESRIAEKEADGKTLSKAEKSSIQKQVVNDLVKGYIDIDTIESVLGGETYDNYKSITEQEESLQNEFNTLNQMKQGDMTGEQIDKRAELKQQLEELKNTSKKTELRDKLSNDVFELVKDSRLAESYNEKTRRGQSFEADLSKYDTKQQEVIKKAVESGILNNTNRTHEFVDMIAKISADKGVFFDFTNNEKLKNSGFAVEGKTVNGYKTEDGNIALNIQSHKALESVVGHEITHILEGTELYSALQEAVKQYATTKGEYVARMQSLRELYTGVYKGTDFDAKLQAELTADIVGEYLFSDSDFINSLSTEQPNLFKKIYNEIKYLCKVATAGSKEARELEKVKKAFENAWKESGTAQKNTVEGEKNRYSLNDNLENVGKILYDNNNPLAIVNRAKTNNNSSINWVYKSEIFSVTENKLFHEKISEINQGSQAFEKNSRDEYMIPIENKIVFTDGSYESPYVREIIEVLTEYQTEFEQIRERIFNVEKGKSEKQDEVRTIKQVFGDGIVITYRSGNNGVYGWQNGKRKGKTRRTVVRNYLNKQYRTGNDKQSQETQINEIAPTKETSSKDGVFSNGKNTKYSLSDSDNSTKDVFGFAVKQNAKVNEDLLEELSIWHPDAQVDSDGNVTVYHRTSKENADKIRKTGVMTALEDALFFSSKSEGYASDYGDTAVAFKIPSTVLRVNDIFDGEVHFDVPLKRINNQWSLNVSKYLVDEKAKNTQYSLSDSHKEKQLDIINKYHPKADWDYQTWITSVDDIKTFAETVEDESNYATTPDFTDEDVAEALKTGKVKVYSSHDIRNGTFVTPSYMEAKNYAGQGKVNSMVVNLEDVAWIDSLQGQYAPVETDTKYSLSDSNGRELSTEQSEYFKESKIRDADGNLKVMYHGSPETFTVFDRKKARSGGTYGSGFYFTDSKSHAGTYGDSYVVYLNITNPLQNGTNDITKEQLRKFVEEIAKNEDYGIENYGYGATIDSVVDSVYGKSDFGMLMDLNVSCIGDMVEAVKLFNEVNGTDYDGIVAPTETVAFHSEQIKNIDNKKPTSNPDIRYSLSKKGEQPTKNGRFYGKDMMLDLPIREDIAKNTTTTFDDIAPIREDEANAMREEQDNIAPFTDADVPPEFDAPMYDATDTTSLNEKTLKNISAMAKDILSLNTREKKLMEDIVQKYSTSEISSKEELFDDIKKLSGEKSWTERNDEIAEIKKVLRDFRINVSPFIKRDITDYSQFMRSNFGKLRFSKDGLSVDDVYIALSTAYPHFFPADVVNPTDQLLLMSEVANTEINTTNTYELDDDVIQEATDVIAEEVNTYKEQQLLKLTEKEHKAFFKNVVASDKPIKTTRADLHNNIVDNIKTKFAEKGFDLDEVLKKAKDLSTFATVDNTPQRVMEKALGYKEGQILADETVNKVAQNETEGIKWLNSFTNKKNGLLVQISKQYNIKPGSKESAAAQMYAEGFYVNDNNDIIKYGDEELKADFPDAEVRKNIKGLANDPRIRLIYDETLAKINESRSRNAYPEIPRLENYFLHFRAMEDTFSRLGLPFNPNDIRAKDLPTDLNGVTADLKPGQPYFASAMHRTGKTTSFDLLGGLERYLSSAKNQIYHIDDIQTLRALRNFVADTYGQATGLENLDKLSEEEVQERIKQVYGSHLSTFAKFLNEEANILAGKTSLIDRGLEGVIGRRGITFLDTINKQVGSNMVGLNISSSLTNILPVVQTFAKSSKFAFTKAFAQTVSNRIRSIYGKSDGFKENSPVVIRRKGAESFYRTPFQKVGDIGYILMSAVDDISTELIARTKYNELTRKGMDSQQAHIETDKWVSRLMGDRSLGQQPQLYNSKMLGLITKFQLEVRNQLDSQFYDTIQEAKVSNEQIENALLRNAKTAAKVGSTFFQLAVLQHLFGTAFESVAGYNPAFDIVEVLIKAFGFDDDEEDEDTALDNIEEAFLTLLEDLPYTSTLTGGRIPISSALPIKELVTGEDDYGTEKSRVETLKETLPYYLLPGGYGQLKKTVQGLKMFDDDLPIAGSYTDSGNLRFPVEDTPLNRVQAGLFGQYANKNARKYFDDDIAPLNEKQIKEYADLDLPIADYWKYREGLKGLETLNEKGDYIGDLDLPISKKNILINNIADRDKPIDYKDFDLYSDFEEFDFATRYPEKYAVLKDQGISVAEYKEKYEETAFMYTDDFAWASNNPEKYTLSKAVTNDVTKYKQYTTDLYNIKSDKDSNGKSISGSRKKKVLDYINNLDIDYGAKCILLKSEYSSDDTYNKAIVDYLLNRDDITTEEKRTILEELGATIDSNGYIHW